MTGEVTEEVTEEEKREVSATFGDCPWCMHRFLATPFLAQACSSVAAAQGRTLVAVLVDYLAAFHLYGHPGLGTDPEAEIPEAGRGPGRLS